MRPGPAPRLERAFERSYRRHVRDVYHYALGVLRDPLDAEDVTHTTFLNAYCEFRLDGSPPPRLNSLLSIAHEVCRLRGGHQRVVEPDVLVEEELTSAADVRRALGRLPFDQRAVLVTREEGSLSCHQAEFAISRELDDSLSRRERRLLRVHLRSCEDCDAFARGQYAQREAIRALAAIPLPETLESFFGTRRARPRLRFAARLTALAGTTALAIALLSSGAVPSPAGLLGQEPEPGADAAVVKQKHAKRKFPRPPASP